uniref:Uncharacterized protein n=1 Tax=Cucumis sativus TaxID=3659 RepID=A0A0A0LK53_CUCSA
MNGRDRRKKKLILKGFGSCFRGDEEADGDFDGEKERAYIHARRNVAIAIDVSRFLNILSHDRNLKNMFLSIMVIVIKI